MYLTIILYVLAVVLSIISFSKNKEKTLNIFRNMFKSVGDFLPQLLMAVLIVYPLLSFTNSDAVESIMQKLTGFWGMLIAGIVGSLAYLPAVFAFPMSEQMLSFGVGYMQITMFISTLSIVNITSMPMELKYFGVKTAVVRNALGFVQSILISFIMTFILSVITKRMT